MCVMCVHVCIYVCMCVFVCMCVCLYDVWAYTCHSTVEEIRGNLERYVLYHHVEPMIISLGSQSSSLLCVSQAPRGIILLPCS